MGREGVSYLPDVGRDVIAVYGPAHTEFSAHDLDVGP